jgi:hypothetical protein
VDIGILGIYRSQLTMDRAVMMSNLCKYLGNFHSSQNTAVIDLVQCIAFQFLIRWYGSGVTVSITSRLRA